ncbi:transcriptional regulator [Bradyrhizobium sp. S3.7.6]
MTKAKKPGDKRAEWINPQDPVLLAIRETRGLASEIAKICGIKSPNAPHAWKRVPAEHVIKVGEFLRIARHRIRPDIYPAS